MLGGGRNPPGRISKSTHLIIHTMKYQRFTNPDGSTCCWVNLDAVLAARPTEDGKVVLQSASLSVEVDALQFEEALKKTGQNQRDMSAVINRLIQAIDRLSVRIPTSIRMHM